MFANGLWILYQRNTNLVRSFESIQSNIILEYAHGSETIHSISESDIFYNYLGTRAARDREKVALLFEAVLEDNPRYDQIRFINNRGDEIIRVNRQSSGIETVASEKLQNKSNRYYFLDTMKLNKNEIYVSPLDLNVDDGKIEQPEKPTVRMSTPVFYNSEKVGIVIINYNATEILQKVVADATEDRPYLKISLVNSDGFYLYNEDQSKTWGFMYPYRSDQLFYKDYPPVWNTIKNKEYSRTLTRHGLFLFNKLYPIQTCQEFGLSPCESTSYFSRGLSTRDYYLIVVGNASLLEVVKQIGQHIIFPSIGYFLLLVFLQKLLVRKSIIPRK